MKKIFISSILWAIGGLFFIFSSCILILCFFTTSKKNVFSTARFLFRILIRLMGIRLVVTGTENIEKDQPYVIMGNHQSLFDVFVIPTGIPLVFTAVEASYHFSYPIWGYLVKKWGVIPIERENLKKAIESLELAKKALTSGMDIAILPEGHRTRTGELGPFKKGPFHMAKSTQADILPFGINGLYAYNKKGSFMLTPGVVTLNIGKPIRREEIEKMSVEQLREKLFTVINDLSRK